MLFFHPQSLRRLLCYLLYSNFLTIKESDSETANAFSVSVLFPDLKHIEKQSIFVQNGSWQQTTGKERAVPIVTETLLKRILIKKSKTKFGAYNVSFQYVKHL